MVKDFRVRALQDNMQAISENRDVGLAVTVVIGGREIVISDAPLKGEKT